MRIARPAISLLVRAAAHPRVAARPLVTARPLLPLRNLPFQRLNYTSQGQPPPPHPAAPTPEPTPTSQQEPPSYELTFTCRPCTKRSTHRITKQAYHSGSVLITCPGCSSRHVIADHLKIFGETARSFEDILKGKGEVLKKARLSPDGSIEILPPEEQEPDPEVPPPPP